MLGRDLYSLGGPLGTASTLATMNLPLLRFTDGSTRVVYTDRQGQYVLGDDGEPVYGVWLRLDEYCEPCGSSG